MMISKESLSCPVCRAGFRGQSECSRCGADLTGLMKLAVWAYYLRDKARADIRSGDINGACERLRQARNLHNTAVGQDLQVLAHFLRTIATPVTVATPAPAVTVETAATATYEITAAVEQDSVIGQIPQPAEATGTTSQDNVAAATEAAQSVAAVDTAQVPTGEQAVSAVEDNKVVPPVQSSYMQEPLSTARAQTSSPTGEHLTLPADEQSTSPAGEQAFTPAEEQTTSSADTEQEPPQEAALPPSSAVHASPGRAIRRVRLVPEKSIIATDKAGPLGKLLRRLAFWRRF